MIKATAVRQAAKSGGSGRDGMYYSKVEICGVNTAKLKVLKEKENRATQAGPTGG